MSKMIHIQCTKMFHIQKTSINLLGHKLIKTTFYKGVKRMNEKTYIVTVNFELEINATNEDDAVAIAISSLIDSAKRNDDLDGDVTVRKVK